MLGRRPKTSETTDPHRWPRVLEDERATICRSRRRADDGRFSALCLSGGGIRSATFCLGVLQGLARYPRTVKGRSALESFDYLSTVSGGGYIGSWLSRWIQANPTGLAGVAESLANDSDKETQRHLGYLRSFSNYLSPRGGVSTDTLTVVGIFGRNLLLNWLVLLPAILIALLVPRFATGLLAWAGRWSDAQAQVHGAAAAPWPWFWGLTMVVVGFALVTSVIRFTAERLPPEPGGNEDAHPFSITLPLAAAAWLLAWTLLAPLASGATWWTLASCVVLGIATHLLGGWLGNLRLFHSAPPTPAVPAPDIGTTPTSLVLGAVVASGTMAGVFLWLGTRLFPNPGNDIAVYVVLAGPYLLATYWFATVLYAGMVGIVRGGEGGEPSREWWARAGATTLRPLLGWVALSSIVLYLPLGFAWLGGKAAATVVAGGGLGGLVSGIGGFFGKAGVEGRESQLPTWRTRLQEHVLPIAATAFLLVFALMLTIATSMVLTPAGRAPLFPRIAGSTSSTATQTALDDAITAHRETIATANAYARKFADESPTDLAGRDTVLDATGAEVMDLARQMVRDTARGAVPPPWMDLPELTSRHRATTENIAGAIATRLLILTGILMSVLFVGWGLTGVNRFSLHAMYGNRLIRAYLGGARQGRNPNAFTDFDPDDDEPMQTLAEQRPLHVINFALNTADAPSVEQPALLSRKATPFTVSSLYAGSEGTGYQPTARYAGRQGITLGRAMTISGAAVSPAMGYHSSAPVSAVMTLFNARLGWWLPNPGKDDADLLKRAEPTAGVLLLLAEAAGLMSEQSNWIHLSDGGHFDNLGLYEMLRRRCRLIVCVDASQDAKSQYDDLVRTMRMARADLDIAIDFPAGLPVQGQPAPCHYALAKIRYPKLDEATPAEDGLLVYIKPTLTGDEPPDLCHYAKFRERLGYVFPHESTADQFFDEPQFEGYRVLGLLSVAQLRHDHPEFDDLSVDMVERYAEKAAAALEERKKHVPVPAPIPWPSPNGDRPRVPSLTSLLAPAAASAVAATTLAVTIAGTVRLTAPSEPIPLSVPKDAAVQLTGLNGATISLRVPDDTHVPVSVGPDSAIPVKLPEDAALPVKVKGGLVATLDTTDASLPLRIDPDTRIPIDPTSSIQCKNTQTLQATMPPALTQALLDIKDTVDHIGPRRNVHGGQR
jgi:hypothetical protein